MSSSTGIDHEPWMRRALVLAATAKASGEVPVGALVVMEGEVVGEGWNQPIATSDPTAHAEIVALRAAARSVRNYRLTGATLVVTVEPCLMCVGAAIHARLGTIVFGTTEPRAGALGSTVAAHETPGLNHRLAVVGGLLADECRALMVDFFRERRVGERSG